MKFLLGIGVVCTLAGLSVEAVAGEAFCRWMGIGHGPGYHAYNGCLTPNPCTGLPGWYPVLLPAPAPAPIYTAWPGSGNVSAVDWSRQSQPAALRPWTGP